MLGRHDHPRRFQGGGDARGGVGRVRREGDALPGGVPREDLQPSVPQGEDPPLRPQLGQCSGVFLRQIGLARIFFVRYDDVCRLFICCMFVVFVRPCEKTL